MEPLPTSRPPSNIGSLMYPDPIIFYKSPAGTGPLVIRWKIPTSVTGLLVYRSPRAILPEETEAFYSQTLPIHVRCAALQPERPAIIDPDTTPAFYCILGRLEDGLLEIAPVFERLQAASPIPENAAILKSHPGEHRRLTEAYPEMIYAASDAKAENAAATLASGLMQRFGHPAPPNDNGEPT